MKFSVVYIFFACFIFLQKPLYGNEVSYFSPQIPGVESFFENLNLEFRSYIEDLLRNHPLQEWKDGSLTVKNYEHCPTGQLELSFGHRKTSSGKFVDMLRFTCGGRTEFIEIHRKGLGLAPLSSTDLLQLDWGPLDTLSYLRVFTSWNQMQVTYKRSRRRKTVSGYANTWNFPTRFAFSELENGNHESHQRIRRNYTFEFSIVAKNWYSAEVLLAEDDARAYKVEYYDGPPGQNLVNLNVFSQRVDSNIMQFVRRFFALNTAREMVPFMGQ
mgnify:CR=1 FL=1